jgi:hypothetical protein
MTKFIYISHYFWHQTYNGIDGRILTEVLLNFCLKENVDVLKKDITV